MDIIAQIETDIEELLVEINKNKNNEARKDIEVQKAKNAYEKLDIERALLTSEIMKNNSKLEELNMIHEYLILTKGEE